MGATAFGEVWLQSITGPALLAPYISEALAHRSECQHGQDQTEQSGQRQPAFGCSVAAHSLARPGMVGVWDREGTAGLGVPLVLWSCVMRREHPCPGAALLDPTHCPCPACGECPGGQLATSMSQGT